jgi:hypothetical protein
MPITMPRTIHGQKSSRRVMKALTVPKETDHAHVSTMWTHHGQPGSQERSARMRTPLEDTRPQRAAPMSRTVSHTMAKMKSVWSSGM